MDYYIINKSYKFRIYPNKEQESFLNQTFGSCRFVWNRMVTCFLDGVPYKERPSVKMLREEFEWMKDISSAALGESRRNFEKTEKQFFNKNRKTEIGKPRFKKKGGVERFLHTRS